MANRTFEQWIDGIFDHEVIEPAWFWDIEADRCVEDDETNVRYLADLFTDSGRLLKRFSDAQVGQGMNMIVNSSCSDHAYSITAGNALWEDRRRAIRSIYSVYADCFAQRCDRGLGHLSEGQNPMNYVCYMWWDLFPAWIKPGDASRAEEANEYISVMARCLTLSHEACLEGALHGLGHWQMYFPEKTEPVVDRYLRDRHEMRPELMQYARRARDGCVQ